MESFLDMIEISLPFCNEFENCVNKKPFSNDWGTFYGAKINFTSTRANWSVDIIKR